MRAVKKCYNISILNNKGVLKMDEKEIFIITKKQILEIEQYCENQPVPFRFMKPIIQALNALDKKDNDKNKK